MTQPPIFNFPSLPTVTFSVHKEPIYTSLVSTHVSGKEAFAVMQAYPVWEFTLKYDVLRDITPNASPDAYRAPFTELQQLMGVFLACKGQYGRFYFDDWTDNSRADSFIGAGDGSTSIWTVTRRFGSFTEPVGAINSISAVYYDGVEVSAESYGWFNKIAEVLPNQIKFNSPPPVGVTITADFTFYYFCRPIDDQQDFEEWQSNLWRMQSCKFRSAKA